VRVVQRPKKHYFGKKCAFGAQKGPLMAVKSIFKGTRKGMILKKIGIFSPNTPNQWLLLILSQICFPGSPISAD
jgi:hypothetical protein